MSKQVHIASTSLKKESTQFNQQLKEQRKKLPIYQYRYEIVTKCQSNQVMVVAGETGSGKTTQIPQYLYEENVIGNKNIVITQPRRVAAITIAQRVSQEKQSQVGQLVGYKVRFEEQLSQQQTRIIFMTDGMLLRELIIDPQLKQFSVVVIDEAHERTINSDLLLALMKQLVQQRKDLKVIIMSATVEIEKISHFFQTQNIIYIEGRTHPIDLYYTKSSQADYLDSMMNTIIQIHFTEERGDILAFLVGQEDIEDLAQMLKAKAKNFPEDKKNLKIVQLYAALPAHIQLLAFQKAELNERKVILSTNIAETSVTIDGIKYVVDSGFVKVRKYDPNKILDILQIVPISKSSALQRAGRSGRQERGKCFRLYTDQAYNRLSDFMIPEILRSNLSLVILQMKAMKIKKVENFEFMDKPKLDNIINSVQILQQLQALDDDQNITEVGLEMSQLPLEPLYSNFLITTLTRFSAVLSVVLSVVSVLQIENLFYLPKDSKNNLYKILQKFKVGESDHLTKANVLSQYFSSKNKKSFCKENCLNKKNLEKALLIREQLSNYMLLIIQKRSEKNAYTFNKQSVLNSLAISNEPANIEQFNQCIGKSLFMKLAKLNPDGTYKIQKTNQQALIHPDSLLFYKKQKPEYIIFNEIIVTSRVYLRDLTELQFNQIQQN